jgi:chorismate mutase
MNEHIPKIQQSRDHIDALDETLMTTLAARMAEVARIGSYKQLHGIPALDTERWQAVVEQRQARALELGLPADLVTGIYELIHQHALEAEGDKQAS